MKTNELYGLDSKEDYRIHNPTFLDVDRAIDGLAPETNSFAVLALKPNRDGCLFIQAAMPTAIHKRNRRYQVEVRYERKGTCTQYRHYQIYIKDKKLVKSLFVSAVAGIFPVMTRWRDITRQLERKASNA